MYEYSWIYNLHTQKLACALCRIECYVLLLQSCVHYLTIDFDIPRGSEMSQTKQYHNYASWFNKEYVGML